MSANLAVLLSYGDIPIIMPRRFDAWRHNGGNIIVVGDFISFVSKKTTVCILISFSYTVVGKSFLLKFHQA